MYTTLAFITSENAPMILFIACYLLVMIVVYSVVLHNDRKKGMKAFNDWLITYDELQGIDPR